MTTRPHKIEGGKRILVTLDADTLAIVQSYPNQSAAVRIALRVLGPCPKQEGK